MDASILKAMPRPGRGHIARLAVTALLLLPCLAACEGEGGRMPAISVAASSGTPGPEYKIAPQDMLEISVYQVPSLSRTVQVDAAGKIDLPLVGVVRAGGRTGREVEAELVRLLGAKYLRSPQVTVAVKDGVGLRYTVDGAVAKPGNYVMRGDTTLLQAIAQAGGLGEVGDVDGVGVARVVNGQRSLTTYSIKEIRSGRAPDPPIYGMDTVVVAESATLNTLKFVKDMAGPVVGVARVVPY